MAIYLYAFEFGLNFEELCQALPFKYLKWNLFIIGLVLEDTLPQAIFFNWITSTLIPILFYVRNSKSIIVFWA